MSYIIINRLDKEKLKYNLKNNITGQIIIRFEKINKQLKIILNDLCIFPNVIDDIITNYYITTKFQIECYIRTGKPRITNINIKYDNEYVINESLQRNFELYDINKLYCRNYGSNINNILKVFVNPYDFITFFNYYMITYYCKEKYININTQRYDHHIFSNIEKNKIIKHDKCYSKYDYINTDELPPLTINEYTILNHRKLKNIIVLFKIFINVVKNSI